jgi:hypothetical protein
MTNRSFLFAAIVLFGPAAAQAQGSILGGGPAEPQVDAAKIFSLGSGLTEYYAANKSGKPMIESCDPGVSAEPVAAGTCGGTGGSVVPPVNPCGSSNSCGPGVGLEGGLIRIAPEQWNVQEVNRQIR